VSAPIAVKPGGIGAITVVVPGAFIRSILARIRTTTPDGGIRAGVVE
jgi:hypothetical protein